MNKTIYLTLIVLLTALHAAAQNTTNLPTSMYGVGELNASEGGRYAGMGNVGVALNKVGMLNTLNPAAITRMDTTCFTFEVGMAASYARYSFLSDHSSNLTGNPNRIGLGFRVMKGWYMMAGMAPYSSMGYLIQTEEPVEGLPDEYVYSYFEGNGGMYRLYWSNAFKLTPRFSIGINIGHIRGEVMQSETQESATVKYSSKKRAFYAEFGMHYEWWLKENRNLSFGLTLSPAFMIKQENEQTYTNSSTDEDWDESRHGTAQYLPFKVGAGMAYGTPRWTLTADYSYLDWSRNVSSYTSMRYENQHKLNVGMLYALHPRRMRSTELMGGIGLSNSYMSLKGGEMYYLEANLGVSFPIRYSFLSLGGTWRRQVNTRANLMQESRWGIALNITFGERLSKAKLK